MYPKHVVNAIELLRASNRPDIYLKYWFARSFLEFGSPTPSAKQDYLESIRAFNGFYEEFPYKNGPQDFVTLFEELISSISKNGFKPDLDEESVTVDLNGEIVGGAHRVAVCAALGINLQVTTINNITSNYDSRFFTQRYIDQQVLNQSLMIKSDIDDKLICLVIHGTVEEDISSKIEEELLQISRVFIKRELQLGLDGLSLLKYINYVYPGFDQNKWVGSKDDNFEGIRRHALSSLGQEKTRIYFLRDIPPQTLSEFKLNVRGKYGLKNSDIHSTDTNLEGKAICELFSNEQFLSHLQNPNARIDLNLIDDLLELKVKLLGLGVDVKQCFLAGSFPLALFNIRDARDFDVFHFDAFSFESKLESGRGFSLDIASLATGLPKDKSVIIERKLTFRLLGFPISTLELIKQIKSVRQDYLKDAHDVEMILHFLRESEHNSLKVSLRRNSLIYAWRLYMQIHKMKIHLYKIVSRIPLLIKAFRFVKNKYTALKNEMKISRND